MLVNALEWLKMHIGREQLVVGEFDYVRLGYERADLPLAQPVTFSTLASFAAFCNSEPSVKIVKVDGIDRVTAYGALHPTERTRETLARGVLEMRDRISFSQPLNQENFITRAQAWFVEDEDTDRAKLLRLVGTLRSSDVRTLEDDGVTQMVSTAKGVVAQAMEEMPNPVQLRMYGTFPEVDQPLRKFIVRISGGFEECQTTIKLVEVPDPMFEYRVMGQIADYLETKITGAAVLS